MKKAQNAAASAAILVFIITALVVLYLLSVPPEERAQILGEDMNGSVPGVSAGGVLLTESPGRIDALSQSTIDHTIPNTDIFVKKEGKIFLEENSIFVYQGLFSSKKYNASFRITDIDNTENILLVLNADKGEGRLEIDINGREVYNSESLGNIGPIKIDKNNLKENNVLTIAVSSPGVRFWSKNLYSISNLKVVGDVIDISSRESSSAFIVNDVEKSNLKSVRLKFLPDCIEDKVSNLKVYINDHKVYDAVPECGNIRLPLDISPENIYSGENKLRFYTERGDYILSHITVESKLKNIDYPVYYFELSEEEFNDISNNKRDVKAALSFVDNTDRREGELIVNGHINSFDARDITYSMDISDDIVRGNNAIKIKPSKSMDIRELKIVLE